jgi:hypothetical protein
VTKDERLWSVRETAEYLGISERTLRRLRIPRVALPGRGRDPIVRYDPAQVKEWLEAYRTRKTRAAS